MRNLPLQYRVELASGAWRQVSQLDRAAFQRLMIALRQMAIVRPTVDPSREARLTVGDLTAVYEVDDASSTVRVLDILRSSDVGKEPGAPKPT